MLALNTMRPHLYISSPSGKVQSTGKLPPAARLNCFRILQCRLPECDARTVASLQDWYHALLAEFRSENIGPRRNRINPRVIKRKMSKWPKKRPDHRKPKPLLQTFKQCVVMKS